MNLSRTNAVKNHCRECAGPDNGNRSASLCTARACYLYPFRNGAPQKTDTEKHFLERANMNERNRLMKKQRREDLSKP
jgi:hypothetical protein